MRDYIMAKVWQDFVHQVNCFDKKIETTNPFSEENYHNKKYSNFHDFYYPCEEHIVVWVEDEDD